MLMVKSIAAGLAGTYLETKFGPNLGTGSLGLPRLFGITPAILTGTSFWILLHGFLVVGQSRSKYMKLAEADGEKEVEERYGLPNLYAQGTSKHARAFNCIQRSHQHIFETFPYLCMLSLVGAVHYPITAATATFAYALGRYHLSIGYANSDGEPSKRYASRFAPLMWYGLLANMVIAGLSCASFYGGKPIL